MRYVRYAFVVFLESNVNVNSRYVMRLFFLGFGRTVKREFMHVIRSYLKCVSIIDQ